MSDLVCTFPRRSEFDKLRHALDSQALPYAVISPDPGYGAVGVPAVALSDEVRAQVSSLVECTYSGWVDYRPATVQVPQTTPQAFAEDIFGTAAIMVLAPCVADERKVRAIAHISGRLAPVMPYLNGQMRQASYSPDATTLTFMDGYRMLSLYDRRVALAKTDDMVDTWRVLEKIRCLINETWARRAEIEPCHERRAKPPALEIYSRLPKTNCRQCGQKTCMAFALQLWTASVQPRQCTPIYGGEFSRLKPAFEEICAGLGLMEPEQTE